MPYNIKVRGVEPLTATKQMPPLTIRKTETLKARLEAMEAQAVSQATETLAKTTVTVRINGAKVQSVVTPPYTAGRRLYRLFYVDGKRVSREVLSSRLLPV